MGNSNKEQINQILKNMFDLNDANKKKRKSFIFKATENGFDVFEINTDNVDDLLKYEKFIDSIKIENQQKTFRVESGDINIELKNESAIGAAIEAIKTTGFKELKDQVLCYCNNDKDPIVFKTMSLLKQIGYKTLP